MRASLDTLDALAHHIRDISDAIADTIWDRPAALRLDSALPGPLTAACHAVADTLALGADQTPEAHRSRGRAIRAVRELIEIVDDRTLDAHQAIGPGVLAAMHLRRILIITTPRHGRND